MVVHYRYFLLVCIDSHTHHMWDKGKVLDKRDRLFYKQNIHYHNYY